MSWPTSASSSSSSATKSSKPRPFTPGSASSSKKRSTADPPGRDRQKSLKILLPLAPLSRYHCAWKMAYFSTEPASQRRNPTGKSRTWDFFRFPNKTHPANRRQPAQPRRIIRPTPTKTASGIPYWPSRDPIGEKGGINLYEHTHNNAISYLDKNGLSSCKCGPDISTVFYSYLRYVSGYLQRLPDNVKGIVDGLAKMQQIGMNIDFWSVKSKPGCGTERNGSPTCRRRRYDWC